MAGGAYHCSPGKEILLTILAIVAAAGFVAAAASVVFSWAGNRPAAWNMVLGGLLAVAVLGGAVIIAWLMTRAAWPD
jgi:hypothetical protein